jgi:hypothetical protein
MQKQFLLILLSCFLFLSLPHFLIAQNNATVWSAEEQRELFNYCEKRALIEQQRVASDKVDAIGQIQYWAILQKQKIQDNTNDTFSTAKEVDESVIKKYKALGLSGDQLKYLSDKLNTGEAYAPCSLITLNYNPAYDTMVKPQMIQFIKTKFRKQLVDKIPVNGRQADQLIDAEVWRYKEAQIISIIPTSDFNRIRKTAEMNYMMERKYKLMDITDQQKDASIAFFKQNL